METELFNIKQLTLQIAEKTILRSVDASIGRGQMVAIVGPNGSGKTTLLKALCGILKPTAGELYIDNCTYQHPKEAIKLRHMLGYAPDTPPLYANDTVKSYLQFIAKLKNITKSAVATHVTYMLEVFDLTAVQDSYICTLSKGTQQRINLAQALIHQPQILILDEPANGLDAEQCTNFTRHLQKLQQQQVTIILASHDYSELIPLCDYMLKIENTALTKIMLPIHTKETVNTYDHADYTT